MAIVVYEQVFGLQISVDNFLLVQIEKPIHNLDKIEPRLIFSKSSLLQKMFIQLTTTQKLNHEIQPQVVLKHKLHACQEWMVTCHQYIFLKFHIFDLPSLD